MIYQLGFSGIKRANRLIQFVETKCELCYSTEDDCDKKYFFTTREGDLYELGTMDRLL